MQKSRYDGGYLGEGFARKIWEVGQKEVFSELPNFGKKVKKEKFPG